MCVECCVFCEKIAAGGDAHGPVVVEGRGIVSFEPLNPVTPGHRLFVPAEHVERADESPVLFAAAARAAALYALTVDQPAYNIIQSNGHAASQSVRHLHVHLVPRTNGDGLALPWR